ncbi:nineteen complex-related protein 2 domain-containing protein [Hirsutella rhossiliensis]|uniref:Nineteen complex-related protein 2 domain-containing protein n=1 Tax=Hirsutella rhossiliensis TaxID=111463 RepID=A0A9P8SGQ4_9HYPO|nr:nineteen complex-related protein 2 domain-containing protein [Hirsutella rhossiliensis]KAH0962313.1 nineteen complex-related protein 2 domain-containing protein [Hirsutella rhossiliensis]
MDEPPKPLFGSRSGRRPFRQSGLRNSLNHTDDRGPGGGDGGAGAADDGGAPVVIRPSVGRSASLKHKKKTTRSRLSFGIDAADSEDADADEVSTPQKGPLGQRAAEKSAAKRGMYLRGLPSRLFQDDDEKPKYSKEYLHELQSSTPSTPRDISTLHIDDTDEMELDASELEGALIVDSPAAATVESGTRILSEAEIRAKKERRARMAKEKDFLSVEDDDDLGHKKKDDTRLLAEDEDLGEGFDDFVEDGGLSLGRRAQRSRRKQERQQMADLISAAEGHSSDASSDSDAERRIAYEAAQTKAGMDGLKKPKKKAVEGLLQVPPKITPLPGLAECLARLQATLKTMESDINSKHARVEQLRREKEDIAKREGQVQALLDETGRKYQEAMGKGKSEGLKINGDGQSAELVGERGLESLGTTPGRPNADGEAEDVEMDETQGI